MKKTDIIAILKLDDI